MVYVVNGTQLNFAEMYQRLADISHAQKGIDIIREDLTTSKLSCITRFFWKILCCTCLRNFFFRSDLSKIRNTVRNLNIGPHDRLWPAYQAAVNRLNAWNGIPPQQQLPLRTPVNHYHTPLPSPHIAGFEYLPVSRLPPPRRHDVFLGNPFRLGQPARSAHQDSPPNIRNERSAQGASRVSASASRESPRSARGDNARATSSRGRNRASQQPVPIASASATSRLSAGGGNVANVPVGRDQDR